MTEKYKLNNQDSLGHLLSSFRNLIRSAYELAPFVVIVMSIFSILTISLIIQYTPFMLGSAVLLVLFLSLSIYMVRGHLGEGLLSLVGGMLSIFAREWTPERYIAFSIAWIGFTLIAILISSLKIYVKNDDIYRQAASWMDKSGNDFESIMRQLKAIGSERTKERTNFLGPVERAGIIRTFVFHRMQIELFSSGIDAIEILSIITKCYIESVSILVVDVFSSFKPRDKNEARIIIDYLFESIRETPVPPEEFFAAFKKSRRLIKINSLKPNVFFENLKQLLSKGIPVDDIYKEMKSIT